MQRPLWQKHHDILKSSPNLSRILLFVRLSFNHVLRRITPSFTHSHSCEMYHTALTKFLIDICLRLKVFDLVGVSILTFCGFEVAWICRSVEIGAVIQNCDKKFYQRNEIYKTLCQDDSERYFHLCHTSRVVISPLQPINSTTLRYFIVRLIKNYICIFHTASVDFRWFEEMRLATHYIFSTKK